MHRERRESLRPTHRSHNKTNYNVYNKNLSARRSECYDELSDRSVIIWLTHRINFEILIENLKQLGAGNLAAGGPVSTLRKWLIIYGKRVILSMTVLEPACKERAKPVLSQAAQDALKATDNILGFYFQCRPTHSESRNFRSNFSGGHQTHESCSHTLVILENRVSHTLDQPRPHTQPSCRPSHTCHSWCRLSTHTCSQTRVQPTC